jgi:hypothetical protein
VHNGKWRAFLNRATKTLDSTEQRVAGELSSSGYNRSNRE